MDNMTPWELFGEITTAYFGKQTYFPQEDGTVYSKFSDSYMTKDAVLDEFISYIRFM